MDEFHMRTWTARGRSGVSMVILVATVAIVVVGVLAAYLLFSSPASAPSHGSNVSCSNQPNNSAVQVSIPYGAGSSSNSPGFSPDKLTLVIGKNSTVQWTNNDPIHHTVTTTSAPTDASFDSGSMGQGAVYTCTFSIAGTYQYHCAYHSWMAATITVISANV